MQIKVKLGIFRQNKQGNEIFSLKISCENHSFSKLDQNWAMLRRANGLRRNYSGIQSLTFNVLATVVVIDIV